MDTMENDIRVIGHQLNIAIIQNKITNEELAERIGVTPVTISVWRCGKRAPSGCYILSLCRVLHKEPNWLLGWNDGRGYRYESIWKD